MTMTDTSTERIELHARKVDGWSFADNDISYGELEAWMHDAAAALRDLAAERDALIEDKRQLKLQVQELVENRADKGYLEGVYYD